MTFKTLLIATLLATPIASHADIHAIIETNLGNIELVLDDKNAPKSVANFVEYANKGFYKHTIFHRVIDGFMIQGGGFTPDMLEKPTAKPIANEAHNGLKNDKYTIAMARTSAPHSATSQFFINVANNDSLNFRSQRPDEYGYAVFGRVQKGQDVVNKIAKVRTTNRMMHQNVPVQPVIIQNIKIIK